MTDDPDVRMAQSIMDYIFRRLALDYMSFEERSMLGIYSAEERQRHLETGSYEPIEISEVESLKTHEAELVEDAEVEDASPVVEVRGAPATSLETSGTHADVETKDTHGNEDREVPAKPHTGTAHTSAELLEQITGTAVDSPLCMTCGTKMRPAGSCYVCEGCGSTSGCS
jgi:ribonucleoside-diphosphate reductase alpha chain